MLLNTILFFSLAATSVLADATTVLAKLKDPIVKTDIPNLKNAISQYPSSGKDTNVQLNNVLTYNFQLIKDVNATTTDAQGSPVPSVDQGNAILTYIDGTVYTDTVNTLLVLDGKINNVKANGRASLFKSQLTNTKAAVDRLADALIAKAPNSDQKTKGAAIKKKFDDQFDSRIAKL